MEHLEQEKKNASQHPILLISVTNSELLETGKSSEHYFNTEGGLLGSNSNNTWPVQDLYHSVAGVHARIDYQDGVFTLQLMDQILVINNAEITDRQQVVRLQHDDQIQIGFLSLRIRIGASPETFIDPLNITPEQLLTPRTSTLEDMIVEGSNITAHQQAHRELSPQADPLLAIEANTLSSFSLSQKERLPLTSGEWESSSDDALYQMLDLPHAPPDSPIQNSGLHKNGKSVAETHLSLAPLLKGMGVHLSLLNSTDEAHAILEELGETIRSAVNGLLKLQQSDEIINNKNLRVIEDNPLRLKMSYEETMALLFDCEEQQSCPVHLSAPAAVAESLRHVGLHNAATTSAINFALNAMLDAFSPEQLMNRFAEYRRSRRRADMDGEWIWAMYCSFFRELSSNRQRGFEKLFWEHFAQDYDLTLRRLNRHGEQE
ncbi:type VI secretion system-associated FHA domain protein TagH [Phytobacter massiliensis]|uniref:type VI secretion system-associated FHA domain protein TagH n=1 Tax=Phytobacter massiliensis TaxID=1485952 RepID=UPI0003004A94|nr:type VI secretion system-associated FHA domain protein TagH [Phytobacter massiliensis]